jgi:two-component system OmpR family sensor kinase
VWWLINRSLAPVERMRRQVAARPADDLSPLPESGLPEEVLPLVHELNLLFERVRLAFEAQRISSPTPRTSCARRWPR